MMKRVTFEAGAPVNEGGPKVHFYLFKLSQDFQTQVSQKKLLNSMMKWDIFEAGAPVNEEGPKVHFYLFKLS